MSVGKNRLPPDKAIAVVKRIRPYVVFTHSTGIQVYVPFKLLDGLIE